MATQDDVRRIALSLPETAEQEGRFAFSVRVRDKRKDFVWVWLERVDPKKARVPNPSVVAIRVAGQLDKEMLLASDDDTFFTEPHYNGYPAVLVRLAAVDVHELEALITSAWRCQAPRALVAPGAGPAKAAGPAKKRTAARAGGSGAAATRARSKR